MQTKHLWMRVICLTQAIVFVVPATPVFAAEKKTITCSSRDYARELCTVDN
jgi:hypothetical protein